MPHDESPLNRLVTEVKATRFQKMLIPLPEFWQRLRLHQASARQRQQVLAELGQHLSVTRHPREDAMYLAWTRDPTRPRRTRKASGTSAARQARALPPLSGLDLTATALRAVSIRQPYVELILRGEKTEEYRSWRITPGPLLLHASRTMTADERAEASIDLSRVPTGALVGLVHVHDTFGEQDDHAWQLIRPARFPTPIPYRGAAAVMRVPMEVVRTTLADLAGA